MDKNESQEFPLWFTVFSITVGFSLFVGVPIWFWIKYCCPVLERVMNAMATGFINHWFSLSNTAHFWIITLWFLSGVLALGYLLIHYCTFTDRISELERKRLLEPTLLQGIQDAVNRSSEAINQSNNEHEQLKARLEDVLNDFQEVKKMVLTPHEEMAQTAIDSAMRSLINRRGK